jgi:hypothetical protein
MRKKNERGRASVVCQIYPRGIAGLYKVDLPRPFPTLEGFFAFNGAADVCESFEIDETLHAILARETHRYRALESGSP